MNQHKRPVIDERLKANIKEVLKRHPGYGHKRIALELKLNKKRILRVMKKFHLMPKRRRRQGFIKPDDLGKPKAKYQNLIENFCAIRPNLVWVGDFTHIRFRDSWVYLATVMDIYTREIVGWYFHYYYNNQRIHTKLKTVPVKFRLDREYLFKELGT